MHVFLNFFKIKSNSFGKFEANSICFPDDGCINPNFFAAYNNLGLIYKKNHDIETAFQYFKQAISINPKYLDAYSNLGYTYLLYANTDEAFRNFKIIHIAFSVGNTSKLIWTHPRVLSRRAGPFLIFSEHFPNICMRTTSFRGKRDLTVELVQQRPHLLHKHD